MVRIPAQDLTGQTFGRLTVLGDSGQKQGTDHLWTCSCECGITKLVRGGNLRAGNTVSCGCWRREQPRVHGRIHTAEYAAWRDAKGRCTNPKHVNWPNYGARGIRFATEWLHDFPAFLAHVGLRPSSEHSLDRIDNDGHYEPGNLRWATRSEQARNQRPRRRRTVAE